MILSNGDSGDIEYSSTILEEHKITFSDGTCDCITKDDFEGIQVILLLVNFNFLCSGFFQA